MTAAIAWYDQSIRHDKVPEFRESIPEDPNKESEPSRSDAVVGRLSENAANRMLRSFSSTSPDLAQPDIPFNEGVCDLATH